MMILLVFEFQDKLSASQLAECVVRATLVGTQGDKRFDVEVRTHVLLRRL